MMHQAAIYWKRSILVLIIAMVLLTGSVCTAFSETAESPISIVMDDNYPPFIFKDEDGALKGILVDEWQLWSERTGIPVTINAMDWAAALAAMKAGTYDVIDTIFINDERTAWLDFTEPYTTIQVFEFHDKDIHGIGDIASLRGFTVAVKAGDNSIGILRQHGITNIIEYPSYEAIIDAAKNGDVHVFIMDEAPAIYYLYQKQIADQYLKGFRLNVGEFHRAVRKGNSALLKVIGDGFNEITPAEHEAIVNTWYGVASRSILYSSYLGYILTGAAIVALILLLVILWNQRLRKAVATRTQDLSNEKERLRITIQSIEDGVIATDQNGIITLINPMAGALTGWGDHAYGQQFQNVVHLADELTGNAVPAPVETVLSTGKPVSLSNHTVIIGRDGTTTPIVDSAAPIVGIDSLIHGVVMVFRSCIQERMHSKRVDFIMAHDSMTGLYNRWYMEEVIHDYALNPQKACAIIMGDLNGLKLINDAFGHQEGDKYIQKTASIIMACCSPDDIIGRWGGDEFLVVSPNATQEETEQKIQKITQMSDEETSATVRISISMGYAMKCPSDTDIQGIIRSAEQWAYRKKLMTGESFRNSVINALSSTLSAKSEETEDHTKRLQANCARIGEIIGISAQELDELKLFSILHDIGKVGIKDDILKKPAALTDTEMLEMQKHVEIGYHIARNNIDLAPIAEYILSHHERWDGKGYPRNLVGEEIPLPARILSVVDAYDAMTHDRIYRKAIPEEAAVREIIVNAGTQFDPHIARVFVEQVLQQKWVP
jgi:diguanylate cyclase (GGDEF)-like protein/PAS domain S-box-containing protein